MSNDKRVSSDVRSFYKSKNVFITGATGFVGKVLIERLLHTCPEIKHIYVLMRPKKSQSIQERKQILVGCEIFDNVRSKHPDAFNKIIPIRGELSLSRLGIGAEDLQLIQRNVNIIFHSAATVKFDEQLKSSLDSNLVAVQQLINISKGCTFLEALVHVSTAFANCDYTHIDDKIYEPQYDPSKLIDTISWMDEKLVENITPFMLQKKPNTYILTKHLAENVLLSMGDGLPIAIVRPAIVGAVLKEPIPGWVDNYNGATFVFVTTGKGLLRSMMGDIHANADIVPVDVTCNMLIAVAWFTAQKVSKSIKVYNCTPSISNTYTWGQVVNTMNSSYRNIPLNACLRVPNLHFTKRSYLHSIHRQVCHSLPAYLMDLCTLLLQGKPIMSKTVNRMHKGIDSVSYFTQHSWQWSKSNVDVLLANMSKENKKTFYFDMKDIIWQTYIDNWCRGTKKFLLKEDFKDLHKARKHLNRLQKAKAIFNVICIIGIWRLVALKSTLASRSGMMVVRILSFILKYFSKNAFYLIEVCTNVTKSKK